MTEQPVKIPPKKKSLAKLVAIAAAKSALKIGDRMNDGTIYAGISPTTHQRMYAAPEDSQLMKVFNGAAEYARELEIGGKKGFRVPDKDELQVLFDNKDKGTLKDTFILDDTYTGSYYWSSTASDDKYATVQIFSTGAQCEYHRLGFYSVRCIR